MSKVYHWFAYAVGCYLSLSAVLYASAEDPGGPTVRIRTIERANSTTPSNYSEAILVESPHKTLYVAGQWPYTANDQVAKGTFQQQVEQTLKNLKTVLAGGGATAKDIVMLRTFVVNYKRETHMPALKAAFAEFFKECENTPPSTFIGVQSLAKGFDVEIDAIAVLPFSDE